MDILIAGVFFGALLVILGFTAYAENLDHKQVLLKNIEDLQKQVSLSWQAYQRGLGTAGDKRRQDDFLYWRKVLDNHLQAAQKCGLYVDDFNFTGGA